MILGKVVKISGDSFNRHEIIHLQSWRGPQKTPSGLSRVKKDSKYKFLFNDIKIYRGYYTVARRYEFQ